MNIRALAFDLDGTLLDGQGHVSPRNLAALHAAREAGLALVVASARWRAPAQRIAAEIGSVAPVVCCSGAQVWSQAEQRDLFDVRLPSAFATALYEICDANPCVATVALDEAAFVKTDNRPTAPWSSGANWTSSLRRDAAPHPRIVLIQGTETVQLIEDRLQPEWAGSVRFVEAFSSQGLRLLTLTAAGADKGVALGVACGDLGIPLEAVAAFGDADNDIEMFQVAGASVAMGQANERVKAHATVVTAPNSEDGVAVAIERLLATGRL